MKNVLLFYAVILFSLLYSCSDVVFTTNNDYSDENEIINLVFTETVGSDTLTKYVFLNENFIDFPKHIDIQSILKSENYSANFPDVDSSFKPLISDLADATESRKLDTSIIKKKNNYKIDYSQNREKYSEDIFDTGTIGITRAAFNSDKTQACIYAEMRCGGECGGGTIVFLNKINGTWKIVGQKELWVS